MRDNQHTLRNLVSNERGNVLITFGLTSMVAIASVGGAIDYGRANHERSKMQNVLDAALVSGVAKYRETNDWALAKAEAQAIFNATFTNSVTPTAQNPNPTVAVDQPRVTITNSGNILSGSAQMTVSTPFINMVIGRNMSTLVAGSSIPATSRQLEVAVMVDLTGSMGWSAGSSSSTSACNIVSNPTKKIDYLKCAGEDLLNILLPASGANSSSVRVGIAPFADYVNAGVYADEVTGLSATGGSYANLTNLASTRQGSFSGTYSGTSTTGSQFGAMGTTPTAGSTVTTSGGTYNNSYCSVPTNAATPSVMGTLHGTFRMRDNNRYWGVPVTITGTKPTSILEANSIEYSSTGARKGDQIQSLYYSYGNWYMDDVSGSITSGYYVPVLSNASGLTAKTYNGKPVGVKVPYSYDSTSWGQSVPTGFQKNTSTGYYKVTSWNGTDWNYTLVNGTSSGNSNNREIFIPLYDGMETGYTPAQAATTKTECTSTSNVVSSSKLISCVTERKNGNELDYTAEAIASNRYVGAYNHGVTSKSNYSSDGKCWVGGRELPAVIPLTNNRDTISSFFTNATVGGATPGHLGTAWASYLLSPAWSTIWPSDSTPSAYNSTNIKKAAILMTDGEYNLQFSTGSSAAVSAKQALMLCKQMRDNGISVYTVGFGFAANATPPTPNVEGMSTTDRTTPLSGSYTAQQKALDTLAKCASTNSSYYFPYDGEALRTVFKSIASSLTANTTSGSGRITE